MAAIIQLHHWMCYELFAGVRAPLPRIASVVNLDGGQLPIALASNQALKCNALR
jgi:hypothetical protein